MEFNWFYMGFCSGNRGCKLHKFIAIHLCILGMVQPVAGKRLPREGEDCEIKRPFVDSLSQPRIRVFASNLGLLGKSKKLRGDPSILVTFAKHPGSRSSS